MCVVKLNDKVESKIDEVVVPRDRRLVTVQKILSVNPIEDADAIEVAKVLGWSVVIKKGEYKVGDLVVYAEIDSVMPEREEFEFLRSKRYRIKTAKLRGQISQGIVFPLSVLPGELGQYKEDDDVTDILGVIKYEAPIPDCLSGSVKGNFPSFIPKTNENRVQNSLRELRSMEGVRFIISEKIDGSSATYYRKDELTGVCSRNLDLIEEEGNLYWSANKKYNILNKLNELGRNLAIQGELISYKIQGNKYKLLPGELRYLVYNIFDIDKQVYLGYEEFMDIVTKLELDTVPILDIDFNMITDVDKLVEMSKGFSILNGATIREGLVVKNYGDVGGNGFKNSFKIINPEFLLKYKE